MTYANQAGLGVNNQYGARRTGGSFGRGEDEVFQSISIDLSGEMLNNAFVPPVYMPKGAIVTRAYLRVDEVFVVSTGGTVAIGGAAPGTDGVVLTEAKLESLGASNVSSLAVGTWATTSATGPLTAQKVTKAITGTVDATQGKGTLVVEYFYKTKI